MGMAFPFLSSIRDACANLVASFKALETYKLVFAGLAVVIPAFLAFEFWLTSGQKAAYRPPEIVYVKQWAKSRTDAEIKAQQVKDAPAEKAQRAAEAAEAAARRQRAADLKKLLHL